MTRRKGLSSISLAQVMVFISLVLAGYFIISFGKVALVSHQLRNTKAALQAEVAALEEEVAALEAQKEFVQTDRYIEQAAREEYKMSRPDDQVIVPIFPEESEVNAREESASREPVAPTAEEKEPWRAWWDLFFG